MALFKTACFISKGLLLFSTVVTGLSRPNLLPPDLLSLHKLPAPRSNVYVVYPQPDVFQRRSSLSMEEKASEKASEVDQEPASTKIKPLQVCNTNFLFIPELYGNEV